jgi:hypothetical protein
MTLSLGAASVAPSNVGFFVFFPFGVYWLAKAAEEES